MTETNDKARVYPVNKKRTELNLINDRDISKNVCDIDLTYNGIKGIIEML